jgi:dUTP pyrophosphatase
MFNNLKNIRNLSKELKNLDLENFSPSKMKDIMKDLGIDEDYITKHSNELFKFKHQLKFTKIHPDAITPKYNYETDSGFDLHSVEDVVIPSLGRVLVKTGIKLNIPQSCEIQVRPKSGLALKSGLTVLNTPGTVDEGYTGEIMVIIFNVSNEQVKINKGMKIAQAVLCPVFAGKMVELHEVVEIEDKDRGDNGFGSTGI